ncbi:MAG: hypothetical protein ABSA72_05835 [Nitrososphaerales archaeon]|jgi:hypothetical protein
MASAKAGSLVLLSALALILALLVVGDLLPQFDLVSLAAVGVSGLLNISYMQAVGVLVIVSFLALAVCYVIALERRL